MSEMQPTDTWESQNVVEPTEGRRTRPARPSGYIDIVCYDSAGDVLWEEVNHAMSNIPFADDVAVYTGLKGFGISHPTDSMGSHETWREELGYADDNRPKFNEDNVAVFEVNTAMQLHGVIITTGEDKGGTAGVLLRIVNFDTPKNVDAGQCIEVAYSS